MNYYIGIDLGTSACKGILTNREGTVLAEHSVSYPVSTPCTNWSEQGPSMGGALLAMVACGEYETVYEAADATVKKTLAVGCDPALKETYDKDYNVYRQLYPALKGITL